MGSERCRVVWLTILNCALVDVLDIVFNPPRETCSLRCRGPKLVAGRTVQNLRDYKYRPPNNALTMSSETMDVVRFRHSNVRLA